MEGLIGKKIGMSQIFKENGNVVPVTLLQVGPCYIVGKRTIDTDGYNAVILGFEEIKKTNKPLKEIFDKAKIKPLRHLFEFRVDDPSTYEVGKPLTVEIFEEGEIVNVTGWTKGKGFQGVVKRFKVSGGPKTHGSRFQRIPGSIGAGTYPGEVKKGAKLPGRMGNRKKTIKNLAVVEIDKENNLIVLKGAIPGARNSIVLIKKVPKKLQRTQR
jgi:large subunit ribosomal protein L3